MNPIEQRLKEFDEFHTGMIVGRIDFKQFLKESMELMAKSVIEEAINYSVVVDKDKFKEYLTNKYLGVKQ